MNSFFDRYNLSAFERRLAGIAAIAIFLLFNMILIWPRFSEWGELQEKNEAIQQRLRIYNAKLSERDVLEKRLGELEKSGFNLSHQDPDAWENQLIDLIQRKARKSNLPSANTLQPSRLRLPATKGEKFFEQRAYSLVVNTGDEELVDFLLAIGSEDSGVRVRDLDISPKGHLLSCTMILVANYQLQPSEKTSVQKQR